MDETRITRTIDLDADLAEVWRALTDPALLASWLGDEVDLEVRPGGEGTVVDGGERRRARVDEVDPDRRLALSWWPEDRSGPASTVELELEPTAVGTRLVVTETLAPHAATASTGRWGLRLLLLSCCLAPALVRM
ncbi:MAG TPA: SRPBCC family protein [Acidimicrobiales bacterium]|nr:SRPBCC family protein [Acidimicrobiales bacterium]